MGFDVCTECELIHYDDVIEDFYWHVCPETLQFGKRRGAS